MAFPLIDGIRTIEFGTPGEMRDRLADLVVNGQKRATAGLVAEYENDGETIEHVGELLALLDTASDVVGVVRVTRVEQVRFADVPDEFALAEAEGDLDAADFRASHLAFWTEVGETITDDTEVSLVWFDLLDAGLVSTLRSAGLLVEYSALPIERQRAVEQQLSQHHRELTTEWLRTAMHHGA